jgi:hypothetical protein
MTAFLWTVVILMAAALVAEILAFVGMAVVAMRAARRAQEITEQVTQRVQPSVRLLKELTQTLQPQVETIRDDSKEIGSLVVTRARSIEATYSDVNRRAALIRLRFNEGVRTVEQQRQLGQESIRRDVVAPIQAARKMFRGLSLALWLLRKVA